jgi:uncharacterized protein YecT (DUF1311 family)
MASIRACLLGGALLLLLAGLAHPAAAESPCEDADLSGAERLACLTGALAEAEAEMDKALVDARLETKVLDAMTQQDNAQPHLSEAQESWLTYREAHCGLQSLLSRPVEDQEMAEIACRLDLTRLRASELQVLRVSAGDDDCGCTLRHQELMRNRLRRAERAAESGAETQ